MEATHFSIVAAPCDLSALATSIESKGSDANFVTALRATCDLVPAISENQRDSLIPATRSRRNFVATGPSTTSPHSSHIRLICGVPVRCRTAEAAVVSPPNSLLLTPSTSANLSSVALALSPWTWSEKRGTPVLVEGVAGCGKSSTLHYIAALCGFGGDIVMLQLDNSLDSKALLGNYVCADRPGEFYWQPGVVTEAMQAGRWLVIEDIDQASGEVLSALISLMQSRTLLLPGRPEPLVAHPDFLLLATRTTSQPLRSTAMLHGNAVSPIVGPLASIVHLWMRVSLRPLDSTDHGAGVVDNGVNILSDALDSHAELRTVIVGLHPTLPRMLVDAILQVSILYFVLAECTRTILLFFCYFPLSP
jgi:hypothetical protein